MYANNYISTLVENQLPDFIRADHPTFVNLVKKYYEYLEQSNKTLDVGKKLYDYMDIDSTRADLLKYFKSQIIPNFPEQSELSTEKLIKASKEFYAKKGTPGSFKFIFQTLYNQEVDIYFPKEDILRASDGKWKLPQALRLAFSDTLTTLSNGNVNVTVAASSTITSNGMNLVAEGITANSFIQIGTEKRKVINVSPLSMNVEVPFAGNATSTATLVYDSAKMFKVTLSEYADFDVNLLERRQGFGEISRTSCIIEKAVQSVDKETGREIVEIYVSNVRRLFDAGENLVVDYVDTNGNAQTFKSKIISVISNITLFRNRFGVVQTGRKYKTGDPVVVFGGLADTPDAAKAVAYVNNVSTGSIESISVLKEGYFFRTDPNSLVRIFSTSGIGANVLINGIWDDGGANSNTFNFNTDALVYKKDILLNDEDGYDFDNVTNRIGLTIGAGNTTTSVNLNTATYAASSVNDYYKSFVLQITDGTGAAGSPNSAVISSYSGTTKVATLATSLAVAPDATSNVRIFANAQTEIGRAFTFETVTLGKIRSLDLEDGGSFFEEPPTFDAISLHESDYSVDQGFLIIPSGQFSNYNPNSTPPSIRLNSSNNVYSLANGFYTGSRLFLDVGDTAHYAEVVDYIVTNAATSANVKTLFLDRKFENNINPTNILNFNLFFDFRPTVRGTGVLGTILLQNGGSGYDASNDIIEFVGTGYGANATMNVDANGTITSVTLTDRGEGYVTAPGIIIRNTASGNVSSGSGAIFEVLRLSDGEEFSAGTTDIGRIQDFRITNRGFDYANTPVVSLKVVDVLTDNLLSEVIVIDGDSVWQGGSTNTGATFRATVDEIYRPDSTNTVIRLFNYNGSINIAQPLQINTSTGNVTVNVFVQNAAILFNEEGIVAAEEKRYPHFYGDGLAKANAEFLRGLIKYDGFYLNTDGFISADKKLQNKDYYHNYSYEIQSERSLDEYKETIYRVAHPAGMQLLSKYLIKNEISAKVDLLSNLHSSNSSVSTNANTSYESNLVYGNSSNWTTFANANDLIVINTTETASLKQYTKLITAVPNNDVIIIESPIGGIGDGRLRTVSGNANVFVFANSSAVSESIEVDDNISFNISGTEYRRSVVSVTGNVVELNATAVSTNTGILYSKTPIYNVVGYTIIKTHG
jgi:hypothetical protein